MKNVHLILFGLFFTLASIYIEEPLSFIGFMLLTILVLIYTKDFKKLVDDSTVGNKKTPTKQESFLKEVVL